MCALRSHIQGLAALRSKSGVWPLLRSRQHCLSATALTVRSSSAFLGRGFRLPRHSSARLGFRLPRAGVSNSPATRQAMAGALNCGGFSLLLRRRGSRRTVAAPTYAASCARGPPPRACAARGAPAPSRRPRSLRSRPAGVVGASLRFGRAVLATLAGFFSATALGVAAAAGCA